MNAKISKISEMGVVLNVKNDTNDGIIVSFDQITSHTFLTLLFSTLKVRIRLVAICREYQVDSLSDANIFYTFASCSYTKRYPYSIDDELKIAETIVILEVARPENDDIITRTLCITSEERARAYLIDTNE